jgi:hypothetical protein
VALIAPINQLSQKFRSLSPLARQITIIYGSCVLLSAFQNIFNTRRAELEKELKIIDPSIKKNCHNLQKTDENSKSSTSPLSHLDYLDTLNVKNTDVKNALVDLNVVIGRIPNYLDKEQECNFNKEMGNCKRHETTLNEGVEKMSKEQEQKIQALLSTTRQLNLKEMGNCKRYETTLNEEVEKMSKEQEQKIQALLSTTRQLNLLGFLLKNHLRLTQELNRSIIERTMSFFFNCLTLNMFRGLSNSCSSFLFKKGLLALSYARKI